MVVQSQCCVEVGVWLYKINAKRLFAGTGSVSVGCGTEFIRLTVRNGCGTELVRLTVQNSVNGTERLLYGINLVNGTELGERYGTVHEPEKMFFALGQPRR